MKAFRIFGIVAIVTGLGACSTRYTYRLGFEKSPMTLDEFTINYNEAPGGQFADCKLTYTGKVPVYLQDVDSPGNYFEWSVDSGVLCPGQTVALKCEKTPRGMQGPIPHTELIRLKFVQKPESRC